MDEATPKLQEVMATAHRDAMARKLVEQEQLIKEQDERMKRLEALQKEREEKKEEEGEGNKDEAKKGKNDEFTIPKKKLTPAMIKKNEKRGTRLEKEHHRK